MPGQKKRQLPSGNVQATQALLRKSRKIDVSRGTDTRQTLRSTRAQMRG